MFKKKSAPKKEEEVFIEIDVECVQKGMKAAKDVVNNYGTIVVRKNSPIQGKHLAQLKQAGVKKIAVQPPEEDEKKAPVKQVHINDFPEHRETLKDVTFMIVDDSRSVRLVLKSIIEEMGLTVVGAAGNVGDALERARKLKPDYITLDISMPGADGTEAIRPLMSDLPNVKIIMISTLGYQDRIVEALELGAVQFISKPFDRESLKSVIINTIIKNQVSPEHS